MSVADMSRLNGLVNATGALARDLTVKLPSTATLLKMIVKDRVIKFHNSRGQYPIEYLIDLYDFAYKVQESFFLDDSTKRPLRR